jgi:hypothetical protein
MGQGFGGTGKRICKGQMTQRWGPTMAALLAVACAGANPKSQRMARVGKAEDAKELETLPTIRLALDIRGGSIGLVGAGNRPMCDGPITGSLIIRAPGGGAERISVQVAKLSARVCASCDPVQGIRARVTKHVARSTCPGSRSDITRSRHMSASPHAGCRSHLQGVFFRCGRHRLR